MLENYKDDYYKYCNLLNKGTYCLIKKKVPHECCGARTMYGFNMRS